MSTPVQEWQHMTHPPVSRVPTRSYCVWIYSSGILLSMTWKCAGPSTEKNSLWGRMGSHTVGFNSKERTFYVTEIRSENQSGFTTVQVVQVKICEAERSGFG